MTGRAGSRYPAGMTQPTPDYAIDLSHHQTPARVPWERMRGRVGLMVARAGYGAAADERCLEHVGLARQAGVPLVSTYLFFRPSQPVAPQWDVLRGLSEAARIDVVPAIDVERDPFPRPGQDPSPSWLPAVEQLCGLVEATFGSCLLYVTRREWRGLVGWKADDPPHPLLRLPLWVAHYTPAPHPAVPDGGRAVLWQHRVGSFDPDGPGGVTTASADAGPIDQSRVLAPLPLVGAKALTEPAPAPMEARLSMADRERVEGQVSRSLTETAADVVAKRPGRGRST